jgi:D-sedoheptulose 7-phosphate isomerase
MDIAHVGVALLAGGLATRLRPLTQTIPKALVEVAGRPFIDHQLALLRGHGVRRVVLCLGHLGDQVARHLGNGAGCGLELAYSHDGDTPRGTGGAIRKALPLLGELFWVLYGDSYLDVDYGAILRALPAGALGLMTVLRNDNRWDRSNVVFRDGRLLRYDKRATTPDMAHIDYGLTLLRRQAVLRLPAEGASDLADLYRDLVAEGKMAGYEVARRFYEIGSPGGLEETRRYLLARPDKEVSGMGHTSEYIRDAIRILEQIDQGAIERLVERLSRLRQRGGRLFLLGVGGSAANAAHAVNDFRKIAQIEAYAPTDNVSELTARVNDEGWDTVFAHWLRGSRLNGRDAVFVFSVGGGDLERNISPNLVRAVHYARTVGADVLGIVGRDGGFTARVADACVVVPTVNAATVTPHAEAFQAVVWHLLVSHPALKAAETMWESAVKRAA